MDETVPFSVGPLRDWPIFEEIIQSALDKAGVDEPTCAAVLEGMEQFYAKLNRTWPVSVQLNLNPSTTPDEANAIQEAVEEALRTALQNFRDLIQEIFAERVSVEIELAQLRGSER